jgi:hypothetical protein
MSNPRTIAGSVLLFVSVVLAEGRAQTTEQRPRINPDTLILAAMQAMRVMDAPSMAPLVNAMLSDTASHMRMMPRRRPTASDSVRAADIVAQARTALSPYQDVAAAERDGYVKFLPWLDDQTVFHYNSIKNALASASQIDLAKPTSLIYRKDAGGRLRLVGAMYTAPAGTTAEGLDERLPLGFAHWHQHVSFCGPSLRDLQSMAPIDVTTATKWLAIEDPGACKAAGGVFIPNFFGWMAHVNAFDGDSVDAIWGRDGRNQMHMHDHRPDGPHARSLMER